MLFAYPFQSKCSSYFINFVSSVPITLKYYYRNIAYNVFIFTIKIHVNMFLHILLFETKNTIIISYIIHIIM